MANLKCECGSEVEYDGYNNIEIEDGYIVIKGDAICRTCDKEYFYEELHSVNWGNPHDIILEENNG